MLYSLKNAQKKANKNEQKNLNFNIFLNHIRPAE